MTIKLSCRLFSSQEKLNNNYRSIGYLVFKKLAQCMLYKRHERNVSELLLCFVFSR